MDDDSVPRTFDKLASLGLIVDGYTLERCERRYPFFTRVTTLVCLTGAGETGVGEDVTYEAIDQDAFQQQVPVLDLSGSHTLASFSERLEALDLFPRPPQQEASRDYRRWAFESAALDLALRQAGKSLAEALGIQARPLRFVVSCRLGNPPSLDKIEQLRERQPGLQFKLDPTSDWDDDLIATLAKSGAVTVVDLKGAYKDTPVDQPPDPELYRRIAEGLPGTWIEDPALTPDTETVLRSHRERITWDAPIHSVADVEALPFPPRTLNIKPSRFGSLARLFEAYGYCRRCAIGMYGGGQFELGPGRGHIQYLASLFHADSPNDVAPAGYNDPEPADDLPASPLAPMPAPTGFRWG